MEWMNFRRMDAWQQSSVPRSRGRQVPKRTIESLVREKYQDEEVQQHILKSVKDNATADKILSGELVLPSEQDAVRNNQIATGVYATTPNEAKLRDENSRLKDRLDAIEAKINPQPVKKGG